MPAIGAFAAPTTRRLPYSASIGAGRNGLTLLGYDGPDGFDAADERYYSSAERAALDPDPAQWFASAVQERMRSILDPG